MILAQSAVNENFWERYKKSHWSGTGNFPMRDLNPHRDSEAIRIVTMASLFNQLRDSTPAKLNALGNVVQYQQKSCSGAL